MCGLGGLAEPIVDHETEKLDMATRSRGVNRRGLRRWVRRGIVVAAVLALIPAVLTFLYLPSFVHPVVTSIRAGWRLVVASMSSFRP